MTRTEIPIPRSDSESPFLVFIHVVVVLASLVAISNLVLYGATSWCGLVCSVLWLLFLSLSTLASIKETGGIRDFLVEHLGVYSRDRYLAVTASNGTEPTVSIGYRTFGRRFDYLRVAADRIDSIEWSPYWPTSKGEEDPWNWHVSLWYDVPPSPPNPGSRFYLKGRLLSIGPYGHRSATEALGLKVLEFMRKDGITFYEVPGRMQRVRYARSGIRCELLDSGLLDDFLADVREVSVERAGDARYRILMRLDGEPDIEVTMWTSRKGTISVAIRDPQPWVACEFEGEDVLASLRAESCSCHLEHMSRGHYWMGLSRGSEDPVHVDLQTSGYLKTEVSRIAEKAEETG
jgi:hypothetical protein